MSEQRTQRLTDLEPQADIGRQAALRAVQAAADDAAGKLRFADAYGRGPVADADALPPVPVAPAGDTVWLAVAMQPALADEARRRAERLDLDLEDFVVAAVEHYVPNWQPAEGVSVGRRRARQLIACGEHDVAVEVLTAVLREVPDDAETHSLLGVAQVRRERYEVGLHHLREAVERAPWQARYHYNLGRGLQAAGRLTDAMTSLTEALACDAGYDRARRRLLRIRAELTAQAAEAARPA